MGNYFFFITFNIYGAYLGRVFPDKFSIKILLKASFLASASIDVLSLRLVDDANKNSCSRNGWILPEFCFLRCYGPSRGRRSLQRKKRNEANICPSKKVLLYSTNILTSLFRESEKKANCVWSTI